MITRFIFTYHHHHQYNWFSAKTFTYIVLIFIFSLLLQIFAETLSRLLYSFWSNGNCVWFYTFSNGNENFIWFWDFILLFVIHNITGVTTTAILMLHIINILISVSQILLIFFGYLFFNRYWFFYSLEGL